MALLLRVLRFCLGGCRHRHMYRERRALHGAQVLHWVCEDCNYAVPAIQRTPREHRLAVKLGAIRPATVHRVPADVVTIAERRYATSIKERRRARA
jgi:hypothetical protein